MKNMILIILSLVFVSGCGSVSNDQDVVLKSYNIDEVAKHGTESDCWIVVHDKVYDMSKFVAQHPGGQAILQGCGKDATDLFEAKSHSAKAKDILTGYLAGDLQK